MEDDIIELDRETPDLEDLAAYLDGRLSKERRALVEERLANDEDYYEIFLENVRFLEEEQSRQRRSGGEVVAPAVWWRSRRVAGPAAAAAVLVAAIGLPRLLPGPPIGDLVTRLNAQAIVDSDDDWYSPGWDNLRGGSGPEPVTLDPKQRQEIAFRIGSHTVHLAVALKAGNGEDAAHLAAKLVDFLIRGDDPLFFLSAEAADLRAQIVAGDLPGATARAARLETRLEEMLKEEEGRRYALGRWNEAGRLAALTGNAEVLADVRGRRVARGIEEIEPFLEDLEAALDPTPPDFVAAQKAFSEIARALAGSY